MADQEVLLKIDHLCQYFKSNKAVNDVTFDVKKGEVFGLVGESGCGKTTTGRSIIKLYNITSGNIYFKGKRIAAGTMSYKRAIAKAREEMKTASAEKKAELQQFIKAQQAEIKAAKHDHFKCDKIYANQMVEEVDAKFKPLIEKATGAEKEKLQEQMKKTMSEGITGEGLNLLIGSAPYADDGKDRVKLAIMRITLLS